MKRTIISHLLVLISFITANAQHKIYFELKPAKTKINNSLYNSLQLIDNRPDTTLGFVQTGAFNRRAIVVTRQPLAKELSTIFNSLIDENAGKGTLLLSLRQFSFAELTAGLSETGYCAFRADMYAQNQGRYQLLGSADTIFRLQSSIDVTNALLSTGVDTLLGFIQAHLLKKPVNDKFYSYHDVMHMDSIEKRDIKLYNTPSFTDGLYLTYQSFKNQAPDKEITLSNAYPYPGNVKAMDEKGKLKEVKLNKAYAIVYKGKPYIVTAYGFYPLIKDNDDFTFTGKSQISAGVGTQIAASMFGALGALITSGGNDATFLMKIDYRNGSIIRLKEIAEAKVTTVSKGDSWD